MCVVLLSYCVCQKVNKLDEIINQVSFNRNFHFLFNTINQKLIIELKPVTIMFICGNFYKFKLLTCSVFTIRTT